MGGYAWVTLATNDAYSLGALVLAHSLRRVGTKYELAVLITPGVTQTMREKLSAVFSVVMEVNVLDSKDEANLALLARPELGITFTKLHCWRLIQYEKCVFLDADTLVVRNCDELFEREELSAAPDVGWPDCFNSGVFVYQPSQQTFASITAFAATKGSFDGGDQGLLNMYFSDWAKKDISKHLPFIYNMSSTATYSYLPAFRQFGSDVRIIHFIGITKPWLQYFDTLTGIVQPPMDSAHLQPLLQLWWNIFCEKVHPQLSPVMAGLAGALAQMTLGEPRSAEQIALEEHMRKQSWEQGHIDYMGRDSFDNIWKKISETLALAPARLPSPPKEIQKLEETKTDKTEESAISPETAQSNESLDEVDKGIAQATSSRTEEQSLVNNVPMTNVPKLLEKNEEFIETASIKGSKDIITQEPFTEPKNETVNMPMDSSCTYVLPSHKEVEKLSSSSISEEAPQQAVEPVTTSDSIQSHSAEEQVAITSTEVKEDPNNVKSYESAVSVRETKQSDVRDEKHEKQLSSSSENLVINPVPIQVAESVLQVETKVSTLDPQTASKEVPSSVITPAHLTEAENKVKANGSTSTSAATFDNLTKSSGRAIEALQPSLPVEQVQSQLTKTSQTLVPESKEIEPCQRKIVQSTAEVASECEAPKTSPSSSAPVRPSRVKEIDASLIDVPKVTQEEKGQKRVIKKTVKKVVEKPATEGESTETADGDSTGKKITKKVVKKIVKKPKTKLEEGVDDGAEDSSSSATKQKKTVKSVKKSPKSSETPTADATIPETPSSSTSDAPNPPKRKLKTTTAKTVTKKSEIEQ